MGKPEPIEIESSPLDTDIVENYFHKELYYRFKYPDAIFEENQTTRHRIVQEKPELYKGQIVFMSENHQFWFPIEKIVDRKRWRKFDCVENALNNYEKFKSEMDKMEDASDSDSNDENCFSIWINLMQCDDLAVKNLLSYLCRNMTFEELKEKYDGKKLGQTDASDSESSDVKIVDGEKYSRSKNFPIYYKTNESCESTIIQENVRMFSDLAIAMKFLNCSFMFVNRWPEIKYCSERLIISGKDEAKKKKDTFKSKNQTFALLDDGKSYYEKVECFEYDLVLTEFI